MTTLPTFEDVGAAAARIKQYTPIKPVSLDPAC